ncbi:MAG: DUF2058 domain-containing protein [Granulosicoccus sp.]|nr:DUF2058 domain-containing protein [Granulosicoccus sp.]
MIPECEALIKDHAIDNWRGDTIYRFTVQNRILEIYVNDHIKDQLANGKLAIARVRGELFVITTDILAEIQSRNRQWTNFYLAGKPSEQHSDDTETDDYDEFPVPDDLNW